MKENTRPFSLKDSICKILRFFIIGLIFIISCASVPKEVVELSYRTGQDIKSIHQSYDKLIQEYYEQLRGNRIEYLENEWIPLFIEHWIANGKLIEVAKGQLIWSDSLGEFVSPTTGQEKKELLNTVLNWSNEAVYEIELKRESLMQPLIEEEKILRQEISDAFQQVMWANNTVTSHLHSLRKVQEVQDEILKSFDLKNLRDKIDSTLVKASQQAASGLEEIKKIDMNLDKAINKIK